MRRRGKSVSPVVLPDPVLMAGSRMRLRRLARDPNAFCLVQTVAAEQSVEIESLMQANRGNVRTARSRQLAMYLVHVVLGRPQDVVGLLFGRDRTTVSHACHLMEDRRDDPAVEAQILTIEGRFHERSGAKMSGELENVA